MELDKSRVKGKSQFLGKEGAAFESAGRNLFQVASNISIES